MTTTVLEVRDVTVRFGGVVAVNRASLTIKQGELIGFVGPNGAGKTTLMRVITGMVKANEGQVLLMGKDLAGKSKFFRLPPEESIDRYVKIQ